MTTHLRRPPASTPFFRRSGKGRAGTENERYAHRETALMFPIVLAANQGDLHS
jgi:hypothetical protein